MESLPKGLTRRSLLITAAAFTADTLRGKLRPVSAFTTLSDEPTHPAPRPDELSGKKDFPRPFSNRGGRDFASEELNLQTLIPSGYQLSTLRWTGNATFYATWGCIGCNPERTMANGHRLDDGKCTIAFMRAELGSQVLIINPDTKQTTIAEVADRGGFEAYGYIADLSVATRDAIGGKGITPVEITLLEKKENYSR